MNLPIMSWCHSRRFLDSI